MQLSTGVHDDVRADLLATVAISQGLSSQVENAPFLAGGGDGGVSLRQPTTGRAGGVQLGNWEPTTGPQQVAIDLVSDALDRARAVGDVDTVAHAGVSLSDRLLRIERLEEAVQVADEALDALATMAEGRHWLAD